MLDEKLNHLQQIISRYKTAIIAFSGGVDSTFLAYVAGEILGDKLLLVTAVSSTYPAAELDESKELAKRLKLTQRIIDSEELDIPGFSDNSPLRCYHCKKTLFTHMSTIAKAEGFEVVFDGANIDDRRDYRPGGRATKELGIMSPLCEADLTKNEIRELSKRFELPTAAKPSLACLASRFPYGEKITKEKLDRVGKAESALRKMGFTQLRVRSHGDCARIELAEAEIESGWQKRGLLQKACKNAGFTFVAIDTEGYRTGAMNESLSHKQRCLNHES
jgi:pyridinium-3,5-biscarboxylic acid mononucleotide sulfurtransferase